MAMTPARANELIDNLAPTTALSVDMKNRGVIVPSVVCWRCEESIPLDAPDLEIAGFVKEHRRCLEEHYHPDDGQDTRDLS
jgi:hypothetical protein